MGLFMKLTTKPGGVQPGRSIEEAKDGIRPRNRFFTHRSLWR